MAQVDVQYHQLSKAIIDYGYEYTTKNRPNTPCKQITSATLQLPLKDEFPLITTKKMFTKGVVGELLWFLRGDSNIKYLEDNNIKIWSKDAATFGQDGDVGRNYGVQWRSWSDIQVNPDDTLNFGSLDQIKTLINNLKSDYPINRRHIVTAWNPVELSETALPACHWSFEILPRPLNKADKIYHSIGTDKIYLDGLYEAAYDKNDKEAMQMLDAELSQIPDYGFTLKWHQRSVDTFLGLPFNIASYALLAHIIGKMVNMIPLEIIGDLSNVHFYKPHIEIAEEQLKRNPTNFNGCNLKLSQDGNFKFTQYYEHQDIDKLFQDLNIEDFIFEDYNSYEKLTAEMFEQKQ